MVFVIHFYNERMPPQQPCYNNNNNNNNKLQSIKKKKSKLIKQKHQDQSVDHHDSEEIPIAAISANERQKQHDQPHNDHHDHTNDEDKDDPSDPLKYIYKFLKGLLKRSEQDLADRPAMVANSVAGKNESKH
jgi:hypothetical protein